MTHSDTIIATMLQYMMQVLEQPQPALGNLPICPFARQYRLQNLIQFVVQPFSDRDLTHDSALFEMILAFQAQQQYEVLFLIHPDPVAMELATLCSFVDRLSQLLQPLNLVAYGGHPQDDFAIDGLHTRREPFINFTVQSPDKLKWGSNLLQKTGYYQNWTSENLKAVGFPRS